MEYKLFELKEKFCKWYCPIKDGGFTDGYGEYIQDPCDFCVVADYIVFIRDELK